MEPQENTFIDELRFCLRKSDLIKARATLHYFPEASARNQHRALYEIFKAPPALALPLLDALSKMPLANLAEKVTQLLYEKAYDSAAQIPELIRTGEKNRLLLARIAGDLRLCDALPSLEAILANSTDDDLLVAALTAIGKIGDVKSAAAVAGFLGSKSTKLKLGAITTLADIGGPSAIKKLCESINGQSDTDAAIVDALAYLQDQQSLQKLAELLSSRFVDLRNAAIDHLIAIGAKSIPFVTECLKSDDDDTVIHSLTILGRIGDLTAVPAIVKVLHDEPKNPNVRFAIYEAMERLPSLKSAISLAQGLTDPVDHVSMAAAKAIDNNLSSILIAGILNIIHAEDAQSEKVVATLLDAAADNVIAHLLESEVFRAYAIKHLAERAHPKTKEHFVELLKGKGFTDLLARLSNGDAPPAGKSTHVMAVDDSKTMLKIYMRYLHGMGFEVTTHESPAQALVDAKATKPDLLITDLNMPAMNGLQLSEEIRKLYSQSELPILMVTTQSDVISQGLSANRGSGENAIQHAGIDLVLNKPFQEEDLRAAIRSLLRTPPSEG